MNASYNKSMLSFENENPNLVKFIFPISISLDESHGVNKLIFDAGAAVHIK